MARTANNASFNRITVSQDCITAFNDLKLAKKYKWIILKVSDDELNIEVDKTASPNDLPEDPEAQWDAFSETILAAKSRDLLKRVSCVPVTAVNSFLSNSLFC